MKKVFLFSMVLLSVLLIAPKVVRATVSLPKTFTDNAVLQRDVPVNVWGWANPGEEVTVSFNGQTASSKACEKGNWKVQLPAFSASFEGKDLVVKGKDNEVVFHNVVVGEVWVCGGQSNMEMPLNSWGQPRLACTDEEINGDYSFIRYNRAQHLLAPAPLKDLATTGWLLCKDGVQKNCTAAGFHFAVRLHKELNVPVGLIDSNWGGSAIDWWLPDEAWSYLPELKPYIDTVQKMRTQFLKTNDNTFPTSGMNRNDYIKCSPNIIGSMWYAMMVPWTNYTIKGAIWYQGCSNTGDRGMYYYKQKAMIQGWRKAWNQGDFPFYWVQLANFKAPSDRPEFATDWPALRDAQTQCLDVPKTGQAVIIDIGEEKDIHPRNKFDVGNRLALWALNFDYGKKCNYQSPTFKNMKIDGNKAIITFDFVGEGLIVGKKDGRNPVIKDTTAKLARFAIAGADQKWVWAEAKIIGNNQIVVSADNIDNPVAVRYAWQINPSGCNLYSADGLPATPFRTDNWDIIVK